MPRPNRPGYFSPRQCWRFTFRGVPKYICKGVLPGEKPQMDGIPRRVWDAMNALIDELEAKDAAAADPTIVMIGQLFMDWTKAEVAAGRLEQSKYVVRRTHLQHVMEFFPNRETLARSITGAMTDEFFERFRQTPLDRTGKLPSPYYVHEHGKTLRAMLRWGARIVKDREPARLLPTDPLAGYSYPPQPGAVRGYIEGETVRRFLRWAWGRARWADMDRRSDPGDKPTGLRPTGDQSVNLKRRFDRIYILMLRFQRLTGCRPGEACGLRWSEVIPPVPPKGSGIPWHPIRVEVDEDRRKTRKQTNRRRVIHLTEPAARLLRTIERLAGRNEEFVFPHMRGRNAEKRGWDEPLAGEPWPSGSAASKKLTAWRREAILAGVRGVEDVGPTRLVSYCNRHALASEGSSLGFTDEQIAELMGNTPEVMRKVYAHSVGDVAADTNRRLAELRREIASKRRRSKNDQA